MLGLDDAVLGAMRCSFEIRGCRIRALIRSLGIRVCSYVTG